MHWQQVQGEVGSGADTFEYPKSHILSRGAGLPSSRVFSSFKSLWHTPCDTIHDCHTGFAHRIPAVYIGASQIRLAASQCVLKAPEPFSRARLAVAVVDARNQLLKEKASLVLREPPRLHYPVEQLPARCVLQAPSHVRSVSALSRYRQRILTKPEGIAVIASARVQPYLHDNRQVR